MKLEEEKKNKSKNKLGILMPATLEHGKLPPQAIDLEEAVLGAIMLEKDALTTVIDILKVEAFYKEAHQQIYESILMLFHAGEPVDILTVTAKLKKNGNLDIVGGPYYITQLTSRVASSANIEYHARILAQKYLQRELIRIATNIIKDAFEVTTDVFDLIERLTQDLLKTTSIIEKKQGIMLSDAMPGVVKEIIELANSPDKLTGIPAGFMGIDRTTGGWQKSDLIIIAGRPGMGKTTFALQLALNAAKYNHNVAYFSLEMSTTQNIKKIISNQTEIELTRLNIGKITLQEQKQLAHNCNNKQLNIYIDDTAALTTTELRTKAYKLKQKHNIELIIVDYLQLMTIPNMSKYENREAEIRKISQSLKQLAKELNIPLIVLSQLSREVEKRGGNFRPKLSDLRESGSIENDADIVIFPFRAEYYKQEVIECGEQQYAAAGACLIDIAKGRNIGTSELLLNYSGRFSKFSEYSATFQPDQNLFEITTSAEANPFE